MAGRITAALRLAVSAAMFLIFYAGCAFTLSGAESCRSYSVADGLSNSTVKAVFQDKMGYVWIGTKDGLNRLDGYEIKSLFNKSDKAVRVSNDIVSITGDKEGRMWIGTFNGVMLFDPVEEKFIELDSIYKGDEFPGGVVVGLWTAPDGAVWIATKMGVYVMRSGRCVCLEGLKGFHINSMAPCGDGTLILNVADKGIIRLFTATSKFSVILKGPEYPAYMKVFLDEKGRCWLASSLQNLQLFDCKSGTVSKFEVSVPDNMWTWEGQVHDIMAYDGSTLLVATDNGVAVIDEHTHAVRRRLDSRQPSAFSAARRIMSLYKDRQGSLWIGTFNEGVLFYNSRQFLFRHHPLCDDVDMPVRVNGNMVDDGTRIWIAHNRGISTLRKADGMVEAVDLPVDGGGNTENEVYYMFRNNDSELLFYVLNKGVYSLNINTLFVSREMTCLPPDAQIRAMAKDIQGNIWIAEDELACFNPRTGMLSRSFSTNQDGDTRFMLTQDILPYGNSMLVGSRTSGVWRFPYNANDAASYFKGIQLDFPELGNKNISVLYLDSDDCLWVGTYNMGVYRCNLEKGNIDRFNIDNGLSHNSICGILEDRISGDIWVSTVTGLSRISKKDSKVVNYTGDTGFPLGEVSRHALLQSADGRIYVGGNNGVAEFSPKELVDHRNQEVPAVRITSVSCLDSGNDSDLSVVCDNAGSLNDVKLSYRNAAVTVKFSPLDYIFPKDYRFAYRMENQDESWNYTDRNEVVYSHLPAGHYKFQVKCCDSSGIWSGISEVEIEVTPPVWLTLWAKLLYVAVAIAVAIAFLRYLYKRKTEKYRRRIEEIEKENKERNYRTKIELFTNFSHELRTPLTLILGPSEDILQDSDLPQKFQFPMKQIYKNSNRLLLLVNQLLDFRKLEHGSMRLKLSRVDLESFMKSQIEVFSDLLKKKKLDLDYYNSCDGADLWIDADLMEKVVFNLLSNAVKHSPVGSRIEVRTSGDADHVLLSVKDCGEGIAEENLKKIFDPFFQVEHRNKSNMFGSGIGLNMASYVVKLHKGRIWAESVERQGAVFYVELHTGKECFADSDVEFVEGTHDLYLEKVKRECISPIEEDDESGHENEDRSRILIVEDDDDMRKYIASILSKRYAVTEASNGKDAFDMALEQIPDLILSDVMMPVMDGIELCREIKGNVATAHIPVVLLTAKVMNEHIEEGYEAMADDYVPKPFAPKVLKAKLDSIIRNRLRLRRIFSEKLDSIEVPVEELSAKDEFMNRLMTLITENASDSDFSVNNLYEAFGMSRSQFFRKIKAVSDVSPNKLILNVRMKLAAEKLSSGKFTVSEVAYDVGYSDPSYFSKVFKSTYGITPAAYLKQQTESHL